ncbi:MAG: homocysteine S-methyltransferase family protein, partial [Kiritimatiellaeota bacterium]|nr:homocysteine S-methyltransferase family protein [Kiritimatiellota bacterium]
PPACTIPKRGLPVSAAGRPVSPGTPAEMAAKFPPLVKAGARCVGGCCGTTPGHIAAFAAALKNL